ncbi:MAG: ferric reductase-like transmembrane domain-containing protein [Candidatus Limnocylindrus sp.]
MAVAVSTRFKEAVKRRNRKGAGPLTPPLPRRWSLTPSDLYLLIGGAAVLIGGMWVRHGGVSLFADPIGAIAAVGQLTALYGTLLALVGILLMSRAPWIDQVVGSDEAASLHRLAGFAAVWLLAVHAIAATAAFVSGDSIATPGQILDGIVDFTLRQEGGLGATVAIGLFALVAIVSIRAARALLAYEVWYGIHLYVYVAVALGFTHQIALGSDFVGDELARNTWIGLYAMAFVPLVLFRFTAPIYRNLRHQYYVDEVVMERPGVVSLWVAGRSLERLPVRAGQWFGIRALTADGWWRSNPFSISAGPDARRLRFTIEAVGDGSRRLQRLAPGTRLFLEGPYGLLTGAVRTREKVLLIAGGIGITPLRALLEVLPARRGDLALMYRVPSKETLVFKRELQRLADARSAEVDFVTGSRESFAFRDDPLSAAGIKASYPDVLERDVYLCGSPRMMDKVVQSLKELGMPKVQIHLERFGW